MHESEWFPKVLLKSDMLHLCNLFNLSIDGFRKESLSSRPVEQIRGLVASSLKTGIGLKKLSKGRIPIHVFYNDGNQSIGSDSIRERTGLITGFHDGADTDDLRF